MTPPANHITLLSVLCSIGLNFCAQALASDRSQQNLIAAGPVIPAANPSSSNKPSPASPRSLPGNKPPITNFDLFPPSKEAPIEPATTDLSKPDLPVQINIEYDESIAPTSNSQGLSVVKALNEALVNGPRAAAVRAQFGIAMANIPQATQAQNPMLFFDRGLVAEQVNRIGPTLTIEPPWKLLFRLLIAKRLVAQTKVDLLTQIWSLRADVRRAYTELVVAQESQKVLEQLYDLAARLLTVTAKRYKAGAVPQLDVLKARLAASQSAVDVSVGKRRVIRAKQQLNILMGRRSDAQLFIAPLPDYTSEKPRELLRAEKSDILPDYSKQVPQLTDFINKALDNRLELKSLQLQAKLNQGNLQNSYANVISNPNITFGKSTSGNPSGGPKLTAVFFTVNAEIPLSNTNQGAIWQYRATQNQLRYQLASQQNHVSADVTSAYNDLLASRKKLRLYQDRLLMDSNQVARLSRRSYEAGQSDITAALNAQQANVSVQNDYLNAVNDYSTAFTNLEFAIGKPLQ